MSAYGHKRLFEVLSKNQVTYFRYEVVVNIIFENSEIEIEKRQKQLAMSMQIPGRVRRSLLRLSIYLGMSSLI